MKKAFAIAVLLAVGSFSVGMVLMAPDAPKAQAAPAVRAPVPVLDVPPPPVVLETSAVLIVAPRPKAAPKARPAPAQARPKGGSVDCDNAKVRTHETTALGTGVMYCHN